MKRRGFLKSIPYAVLPVMVGGNSFKAIADNPLLNALTMAYQDTDKVLVLIQMSGGNDGVNTVLGLDQYSFLSQARANILIPDNKTLLLPDAPNTALHPALAGLHNLYLDGKVKVIQGVGYPNFNYSHFRATDIWMSASDSNKFIPTGWAGRYLQNEYPNFPTGFPNATMPDPLALQIGGSPSPVFQSLSYNMGMAVSTTPTSAYTAPVGLKGTAPNNYYGKELNYTREVMYNAQKYYSVVKAAYDKVTAFTDLPNNSTNLRRSLRTVARLIGGGLKSRVYLVSIGGFDTHANQVNAADKTIGGHANLLTDLGNSIKSFMDELKVLKADDRVLGMTFSEFGRRIKSNAGVGTDHGAAAPVFLFGNAIQGGVLGNNPSIANANGAINDNVAMQYDFRSIYASILTDWFCVPANEVDAIMLKNFQQLPILNNVCNTTIERTAKMEENRKAGLEIVNCYPNPFVNSVTIKYETAGGHTSVEVYDGQGHLINVLISEVYPEAGSYQISCDLEGYPLGTYYVRLQNESLQQVKPILKVQ